MIHFVRRRGPLTLLAAFALIGLAGCSQSVQGTVSLDGNPVQEGSITFTPKAGGVAGQASGPIANGKYSLTGSKAPAPGSYHVAVSWPKKTGQKIETPGDPGVMMDETVEAIPAQYNSATTLTKDISTGSNTLDFDLKSH